MAPLSNILDGIKAGILLSDLSSEGIDSFYVLENDYPYFISDTIIKSVAARLLCQEVKSVVLVGPPGSGKTALVRYLANYISQTHHPSLCNIRILCVSVPSLLAGSEYRGSFEKKVSYLLSKTELYDNLVLFFDEAHCLRFTDFREGIGLIDILKPRMISNKHRFILATTPAEFKHLNDTAFLRRLHRIELSIPDRDIITKAAKAHLTRLILKYSEQYEDIHSMPKVDIDEFISNGTALHEVIDMIDYHLSAWLLTHYD